VESESESNEHTTPTRKHKVPRNLDGSEKYLKHLLGPINTTVPATNRMLPRVNNGRSKNRRTPRIKKTIPNVVRPSPISM